MAGTSLPPLNEIQSRDYARVTGHPEVGASPSCLRYCFRIVDHPGVDRFGLHYGVTQDLLLVDDEKVTKTDPGAPLGKVTAWIGRGRCGEIVSAFFWRLLTPFRDRYFGILHDHWVEGKSFRYQFGAALVMRG